MVFGFLVAVALVWWYVTQPLLRIEPARHTALAVSPARLESHVRALSERFVPRDYTHPENLDRAAVYIRAEFTRAGGATLEQAYEARGRTYRNIVAYFGRESGERIVVGAHYDVDGELPGADDNASGVATLIELAYLLGRSPPSRRVELVAYSLEELPFFGTQHMGSAVHARSLQEQRAPVRVMLSLEMTGYFSDNPRSQQFPLEVLRPFYPSRGNFIAVVGKPGETSLVRKVKRAMRGASPLAVHSINAPRWVPGVDFSDHVSYWDAGYPAVMITDTAWYRNPNYHTASDTPETLDYQRMAMVVQGVDAAVRAIAR